MNYNFVPQNMTYLKEIQSWAYNGHVKSIYCQPYFDSYEKTQVMRGPDDCLGFAALLNGELYGLFEYYFKNDIMEIGLALKPNHVGKGLGREFVFQGIQFGLDKFKYQQPFILLKVNMNNLPAIQVYEKVGFVLFQKKGETLEMRLNLKEIDSLKYIGNQSNR